MKENTKPKRAGYVFARISRTLFGISEEENESGSNTTTARRPSSTSTSWRALITAAVLVWLLHAWLGERNARLTTEEARVRCTYELETELRDLETKVTSMRRGGDLEAAREECRRDLEREKRSSAKTISEMSETFSKKETEYTSKAKHAKRDRDRMRRFLTDLARRHLELRYGGGRYPLPLRLVMETSEGNMTLEMAPFHVMPVAVSYFLNQVESGLWTGRAFFRAEKHVIQASDMCGACDPKRGEQRGPPQDGLPFQEYSTDYVHHKYALGFAGRPGGPDFYVNMEDNVRIHGPGGQGHNYMNEDGDEADSCFGRVVEGTEVAERIRSLPYDKRGGLHILKKLVEIKRITVVGGGEEEEEEDNTVVEHGGQPETSTGGDDDSTTTTTTVEEREGEDGEMRRLRSGLLT